MGAGQLGYLIGSFGMSLFIAVVWLLICKVIPAMRRKIASSYGIAMALALVPGFISVSGINIYNIVGAFLCIALLFWQMKRAQARQRRAVTSEANT